MLYFILLYHLTPYHKMIMYIFSNDKIKYNTTYNTIHTTRKPNWVVYYKQITSNDFILPTAFV